MRVMVALASWITALLVAAPQTATAASWTVDPAHAGVHFSVRHLMVSNVRGQFEQISGQVGYDPAKPAEAKLQFTIAADSIDTGNAKRDEHLRGPDFFDTAKFPDITFVSTSVSQAKGKGKITGDLTLRGVTRKVTFDVVGPTPPVKSPWGQIVVGGQATAVLSRKDFGLTWNKALETGGVVVGDEVTITVDIELQRQ